ncbi:hypothetical protein GCM10010236_51170 [Streptomyces eurythermus]|nr:hypothetical protein GCM10010236_51170 [Streptomyces eurythermus]
MKSLLMATLTVPPRLGSAAPPFSADSDAETAERQPASPSPRSRVPPPAARRAVRREGGAAGEGYDSVIGCLPVTIRGTMR